MRSNKMHRNQKESLKERNVDAARMDGNRREIETERDELKKFFILALLNFLPPHYRPRPRQKRTTRDKFFFRRERPTSSPLGDELV